MSIAAADAYGDYKHPTESALDFDWLVYCRVCAKPLAFERGRYFCANQGCREYNPRPATPEGNTNRSR